MNAPNRSAEVSAWVASHRFMFTGPGNPDDIRREILIPLAKHLNTIEGRNVWGRLIKTDRTPPFIPHDILMWKDTREHFDVFTGAEHIEDTEATWGEKGVPDSPAWKWQDVGADTPDDPPAPPEPPPLPPPNYDARIFALELDVTKLRSDLKAAVELSATLESRILKLEQKPAPVFEMPDLVVEGKTSTMWGHQHTVNLAVKKRP